MNRFAFVDEQLLAKDFLTDDIVRKSSLRDYVLTPYAGRVLFSNPRTGKVAVQWPWGVESESPSELVKMYTDQLKAPSLDQSYSSYDQVTHTKNDETKKANAEWRKSFASAVAEDLKAEFQKANRKLFLAAGKALHDDNTERTARLILRSRFATEFGVSTIDTVVGDVYGQGYRLAVYWKDSNRTYRATTAERKSGIYKCGRCRTAMKKRRFRHAQDVLQCRHCGFTIHGDDLV